MLEYYFLKSFNYYLERVFVVRKAVKCQIYWIKLTVFLLLSAERTIKFKQPKAKL